jgi:hypothetical protein
LVQNLRETIERELSLQRTHLRVRLLENAGREAPLAMLTQTIDVPARLPLSAIRISRNMLRHFTEHDFHNIQPGAGLGREDKLKPLRMKSEPLLRLLGNVDGHQTKIGNHSMRAKGITDYLKQEGTLENAPEGRPYARPLMFTFLCRKRSYFLARGGADRARS